MPLVLRTSIVVLISLHRRSLSLSNQNTNRFSESAANPSVNGKMHSIARKTNSLCLSSFDAHTTTYATQNATRKVSPAHESARMPVEGCAYVGMWSLHTR